MTWLLKGNDVLQIRGKATFTKQNFVVSETDERTPSLTPASGK